MRGGGVGCWVLLRFCRKSPGFERRKLSAQLMWMSGILERLRACVCDVRE